MRKTLAAVVGSILLVGALSSCKAMEPFKDAPTEKVRNVGPAQIIEMPDGFSNLASKCDGPNRVYVAFKGDGNRASIAVVAGDPRCAR